MASKLGNFPSLEGRDTEPLQNKSTRLADIDQQQADSNQET
jgi:hypothetical protein